MTKKVFPKGLWNTVNLRAHVIRQPIAEVLNNSRTSGPDVVLVLATVEMHQLRHDKHDTRVLVRVLWQLGQVLVDFVRPEL